MTREISAQAFSKARQQVSHLAFSQLNNRLIQLVAEHVAMPRWNGLRVVAAHGSKMRLFLKDATRRAMRDVVASALYLPGLEMTLSFQLYSAKEAERQMLFEHLGQLQPDDIFGTRPGVSRTLVDRLSRSTRRSENMSINQIVSS